MFLQVRDRSRFSRSERCWSLSRSRDFSRDRDRRSLSQERDRDRFREEERWRERLRGLSSFSESLLRMSRFSASFFATVEPFTGSFKLGNSLTGMIGFMSLVVSGLTGLTVNKSGFMFGFGGLAFGITGVM